MISANFLPMAARHLRAELRSHRLHKGRLMTGLIMSIACVAVTVTDRWFGGPNWGQLMLVGCLGWIVPYALLFIGLSRASGLLSAERQEGLLPLLLITHLTGWDLLLGKLLQAMVIEATLLLATAPALVLPMLVLGFNPKELTLIILGCANVLFFALALGLLGSVFSDGPKAAAFCALLFMPLLAYSTPIAFLLPGGRSAEWVNALQLLNPCAALAHVQIAAAGIVLRPFWGTLLASHLAAWCFLGLGGWLLRPACRWQIGRNAGPSRWTGGWNWVHPFHSRPLALRTRLLDRNPFLWLTSRQTWPTLQVWLILALPGLCWSWLAWVIWARGINVTVVLSVATGVCWSITLLAVIPREASRQLVQDRLSGALELLLCTPLTEKAILRGQWLCLRRRYLLPLLSVIFCSIVLTWTGYATFGFGGMLDPGDRPGWLLSWLAGICLLPCWLVTLSWMAMRRALVARTPGEASAIALVHGLVLPAFALWVVHWFNVWMDWTPGLLGTTFLFGAGFVATPLLCAWYARRVLLAGLRRVAAERFSSNL